MKKLVCLLSILMLSGVLSLNAQERRPYVDEFGVKAMYVDCRAEVITMDAIKELAADIARQGMNALLIEWEATFPFDKHATLCNKYAYTADEVRDLVAYCATLGVDVIPLQNCFSHSEYILRHSRYAALRENAKDPSQVCPLRVKEAIPVFTEIFKEVAALHPSQYFHIGADETYLLGSCPKCAAVAAKEGKSRLFVDYVKAMSQIVLDMGKTPVIWADIILKHPEALPELPKELIFVDWNYGWKPDYFGRLDNLFAVGVKMWGASAMRCSPDNIYLTQWERHFKNLTDFVPFARESGYTGMVQTSWSTGGTYGYQYDHNNEIMEMHPIRLVYPAAAFNILTAATAKAYNSVEPLEPRSFVIEYSKENYGFDEEQAGVLWDYFTMPQEMVFDRTGKDTKGTPIDDVLEKCLEMKARLGELKPKANKRDFDHYRLMLDLRINYLQFKQVETIFESPSYERKLAPELTARMEVIVKEGKKLEQRLRKLNSGYLKEGELEYMIAYRSVKMNDLYIRLRDNQ